MIISFNPLTSHPSITDREIEEMIHTHEDMLHKVQCGQTDHKGSLGWFDIDHSIPRDTLKEIETLATHVNSISKVMIVIGIGGSNRGAISALNVLHRNTSSPTSLYFAGDSLSNQSLLDAIALISSVDVTLNVIAKDFNTLEPGITFRVLRDEMKKKYGEEYNNRIIVTGSYGKGQLHEMALQYHYHFLPFHEEIGGRFSVLSAVALFPLKVSGINIDALIEGAKEVQKELTTTELTSNSAIRYAMFRYLLLKKGYTCESLVTYEPDLKEFGRWWIQLFGESEGKTDNVLFPLSFSYSEDLHAVGQWIQQGPKIVIETHLMSYHDNEDIIIKSSNEEDGFDYLNNMNFKELNKVVGQAAIKAHVNEGVPSSIITTSHPLNEKTLGGLYWFFLFSVYASCSIMGVHPFNQEGVELYKKNMYSSLGK